LQKFFLCINYAPMHIHMADHYHDCCLKRNEISLEMEIMLKLKTHLSFPPQTQIWKIEFHAILISIFNPFELKQKMSSQFSHIIKSTTRWMEINICIRCHRWPNGKADPIYAEFVLSRANCPLHKTQAKNENMKFISN
jgi:hypothetical protein